MLSSIPAQPVKGEVLCGRLDPVHLDCYATSDSEGVLHYVTAKGDHQCFSLINTPYTIPWTQFEFVPNDASYLLFLPFQSPFLYHTVLPFAMEEQFSQEVRSVHVAAEHDTEITVFHYSAGTGCVATGALDGSVHVTKLQHSGDVKEHSNLVLELHDTHDASSGGVSAICLLKDVVVTAGSDQTVKIWRLDNGECIAELTIEASTVTELCSFKYTNAQTVINAMAAGTADGTIFVWNLGTFECVAVMTDIGEAPVTSLSCSHDGKILASSYENGKLVLHRTGTLFKTVGVHTLGSEAVVHVSFNYAPSRLGQFVAWNASGSVQQFGGGRPSIVRHTMTARTPKPQDLVQTDIVNTVSQFEAPITTSKALSVIRHEKMRAVTVNSNDVPFGQGQLNSTVRIMRHVQQKMDDPERKQALRDALEKDVQARYHGLKSNPAAVSLVFGQHEAKYGDLPSVDESAVLAANEALAQGGHTKQLKPQVTSKWRDTLKLKPELSTFLSNDLELESQLKFTMSDVFSE